MSTRRRKVHAVNSGGGAWCRNDGIEVTDDWSMVTCLVCGFMIDRAVAELSAPRFPFDELELDRIWSGWPAMPIPAALLEANRLRQREAEVAFAWAVLAAYESGEALPRPWDWPG